MPVLARSARWADVGRLEVDERPVADPGSDQVQIKVESAGVCGSDLHFFRGDFPAEMGLTPGHEFAGIVTAAGSNVRHVAEGDRVGIEPLLRCGLCPFCASGDYHVCADRGLVGENADGGFADYALVPAETVFPVPTGLGAEVAALAEPLACSVHGFDKVHLRGRETVFIVGAGTIGLTAVLAARASGANPIVLARHPHQRDAALRLGAAEVIGEDDAGQERMRELRRSGAIDVAVETVGGKGDTLRQAQLLIRPKGRLLVLGVFSSPTTEIHALHLALKEIEIVGSMTYARSDGKADYQRALEIVAENADPARSLITHRFDLPEINDAFATALDKSSRSIKVHVRPKP
ncbi:MAG: alcohol dehydrogenase catalytic domain-containing protein [Acidimicrobiia bacterium]|nr:alcohol dehydrogenase catalytic domain-containing protein [Acidimicrobiia bacterium]